jgi:hypothetical protein
MVIERFVRGPRPVYERAAEKGRMLPEGLVHLDSWIDESLERCFQLMEADDPALFEEWIANWSDIGEFEVIPVIGSAQAAERAGRLP